MAWSSISFSETKGKTGGAALRVMHSLLERTSRFGLRRFATLDLARESTTSFVNLVLARTGMAHSLATRSVDCDGSFVYADLRCRGGRWRGFLTGFPASQVLWCGGREAKGQPQFRR